jgi:hypothetical protein
VYELLADVYTDNGDPIRRRRRTQTLGDPARSLFFGQLRVDMETGVGNAAEPDPQVMLRYSDDDGHTWSDEEHAPLGGVGATFTQVTFMPSGCTERGHGRVWDLTMTDPVRFALFGADVDVVKGA